jgi:hypothetical protein
LLWFVENGKKPLYFLIIILLLIGVTAFVIIPMFHPSTAQSTRIANTAIPATPIQTNTIKPLFNPTNTKTIDNRFIGCTDWRLIGDTDRNINKCVTGYIVNIYKTVPYVQIIRFSIQPGTFLIKSREYYFPNLQIGECIAGFGYVYRDASTFYMEIQNLKMYSYNGCIR